MYVNLHSINVSLQMSNDDNPKLAVSITKANEDIHPMLSKHALAIVNNAQSLLEVAIFTSMGGNKNG